jgi:undecaprenyl-diphosphatase
MRAAQGPAWLMAVAQVLARHSWLALLVVMASVAWVNERGPLLALQALVCAGLLQLAGKRLARRWQAQRPFVLGLCDNHLGHSPRAGFPSSHALVMGAVFGSLAPFSGPLATSAMGVIALVTAWARVHTGAHFPSDVIMGLVAGATLGFLLGWAF